MIAGLLPILAADLHITVAAAGQLVTIFSLAYALGSSMTLSLHASAVYIGIAAGSSLGALTIATAGIRAIGYSGALCQVAGLALLIVTARRSIPHSSRFFAATSSAANTRLRANT